MSEYRAELPRDPGASLVHLAQEAEAWGGEWRRESAETGYLRLPVTAGLRYGWVEGPVRIEPAGDDGAVLTFRVEDSVYRVRRTSATVLLIAALGALAVLVGPFFPVIRPLIPLGFMLSLGAWFFIISQLRNSGPEEFLETLVQIAAPEGPESVVS